MRMTSDDHEDSADTQVLVYRVVAAWARNY